MNVCYKLGPVLLCRISSTCAPLLNEQPGIMLDPSQSLFWLWLRSVWRWLVYWTGLSNYSNKHLKINTGPLNKLLAIPYHFKISIIYLMDFDQFQQGIHREYSVILKSMKYFSDWNRTYFTSKPLWLVITLWLNPIQVFGTLHNTSICSLIA